MKTVFVNFSMRSNDILVETFLKYSIIAAIKSSFSPLNISFSFFACNYK